MSDIPATPRILAGDPPQWYALRTDHEERVAHDLLRGLVDEVFLPRFAQDYAGRFAPGELLFPGYVMFRVQPGREVFASIRQDALVAYLLGPDGGDPSPIEDAEIDIVRRLAEQPYVELVKVFPEKGRRARIVAGPLANLEGVIVDRANRKIRIRSLVHFLGQIVEVSVRPDYVEALDYYTGEMPHRARHRGGRRGRSKAARRHVA